MLLSYFELFLMDLRQLVYLQQIVIYL